MTNWLSKHVPCTKIMAMNSYNIPSLFKILICCLTHFRIEMVGVQAYLAGLTFALAASPCSTPVLATLLGYVATSRVSVPFYWIFF